MDSSRKTRTSLDNVRDKFFNKTIKSAMTNILSELAERSSNSKLDIVNCQGSLNLSEFNEMGSCLPMRKNVRLKELQKRILLQLFMEAENSGKKVTC